MRKLLSLLLLLLVSPAVFAQTLKDAHGQGRAVLNASFAAFDSQKPYVRHGTGAPSVCTLGEVYIDDSTGHVYVNKLGACQDVALTASATPGGTNGQPQYNNGVFGGFTFGGDCTFSVPNLTCTKTNGVSFAASATTDATNASNIASGILSPARGGTGVANNKNLTVNNSITLAGADGATYTSPAVSLSIGGALHVGTSGANSGTGETDLDTYTLPANALDTNGKTLRITAFVNFAGNANAKTVKLYFGSTALATLPSSGTNNGGNAIYFFTVIRTGATSQVAFGRASQVSSNSDNENQNVDTFVTPAETMCGTIVIKVTGQSNTASNDVLLKGFIVEILN